MLVYKSPRYINLILITRFINHQKILWFEVCLFSPMENALLLKPLSDTTLNARIKCVRYHRLDNKLDEALSLKVSIGPRCSLSLAITLQSFLQYTPFAVNDTWLGSHDTRAGFSNSTYIDTLPGGSLCGRLLLGLHRIFDVGTADRAIKLPWRRFLDGTTLERFLDGVLLVVWCGQSLNIGLGLYTNACFLKMTWVW